MFEPFSSGYYLGRLAVEPREGDRAVIQRAAHERVNQWLYASDEGIERLDHPLVMKLGGRHFPVHAAGDVPASTLALPSTVLEGLGVENPPTARPVLLATAERAAQLLRLTGTAPADADPPTNADLPPGTDHPGSTDSRSDGTSDP